MKRYLLGMWTLAIGLNGLSAWASPPQPAFRYYGLLSNEYGWPVLQADQSTIILRVGTNECSRFTANENLGHGINYVLEVPIDNSSGARYAPYAARTGDTAVITVSVGGTEYPLMNATSVPPVGAAGDAVRINLNLGDDADGDGLSDLWESNCIINVSGGLYTDITQVMPDDDFDGDHASNRDEFLAGTAPEWASDVFMARSWMMTSGGLLSLYFYTVDGITYEIKSSLQAENGAFAWTRVPFRATAGGTDVQTFTAKESAKTFFFVTPPPGTNLLYRLEVVK